MGRQTSVSKLKMQRSDSRWWLILNAFLLCAGYGVWSVCLQSRRGINRIILNPGHTFRAVHSPFTAYLVDEAISINKSFRPFGCTLLIVVRRLHAVENRYSFGSVLSWIQVSSRYGPARYCSIEWVSCRSLRPNMKGSFKLLLNKSEAPLIACPIHSRCQGLWMPASPFQTPSRSRFPKGQWIKPLLSCCVLFYSLGAFWTHGVYCWNVLFPDRWQTIMISSVHFTVVWMPRAKAWACLNVPSVFDIH
jgi:hypothetical protein